MVVIAIVGILLTVATLGMRAVRERARITKSMANLRTHVQVFSTYTNENHNYFPRFTTPGSFNNNIEGGGLHLYGRQYFDSCSTWHIALTDGYYEGRADSDVFFPDQYAEQGGYWPYATPYLYPCVFIAHPRYWNVYTRIGPEQLTATQTDWVQYPSEKALIVQTWPFIKDVQTVNDMYDSYLYVGFWDGAARKLSAYQRSNGYPRGDGLPWDHVGAVHYTDWPPLLHTTDGVRGRDTR